MIMTTSLEIIVEAVTTWLEEQGPSTVLVSSATLASLSLTNIPSNGMESASTVSFPIGDKGAIAS